MSYKQEALEGKKIFESLKFLSCVSRERTQLPSLFGCYSRISTYQCTNKKTCYNDPNICFACNKNPIFRDRIGWIYKNVFRKLYLYSNEPNEYKTLRVNLRIGVSRLCKLCDNDTLPKASIDTIVLSINQYFYDIQLCLFNKWANENLPFPREIVTNKEHDKVPF